MSELLFLECMCVLNNSEFNESLNRFRLESSLRFIFLKQTKEDNLALAEQTEANAVLIVLGFETLSLLGRKSGSWKKS